MRRAVGFVAILCSLLMSGSAIAMAQDATPASSAALSGYPEVKVTITDQAIEVDKTDVPAGYVLLTVTNSSKDENSAGVLGPGPGKTMEDLKQAAATPASGDEIPPFLYEATVLGGPGDIQPGQTAQVVVNIPAGDWAVFPEGNQQPVMITASDSADSNTTAPTADLSIDLGDFSFSGFSDGVAAGQQLWKVTNSGKQIHMVVIGKVPEGTTEQQVLDTFTAEDTGTPVPGALQESDFQPTSTGVLLLSSGQSIWVPANLDNGTYVALCFVTDPQTGKVHAMEGMISVFQVGGGTSTPTS
jgi:hypothetical protein